MQTKSKIQLIREQLELKENFKMGLESLMEKYNIEDSIFIYKGQVYEATKGYFEVTNTFDNVDAAIKECLASPDCMGVRVINNKEFSAGYIRQTLMECSQNNTVLDINTLIEIR